MDNKPTMSRRTFLIGTGATTIAGALLAACGPAQVTPNQPSGEAKAVGKPESGRRAAIEAWNTFRMKQMPKIQSLKDTWYRETNALFTPSTKQLQHFADIDDPEEKAIAVLQFFAVQAQDNGKIVKVDRWSTDHKNADGTIITRYKCNIYAEQAALGFTYGVNSPGDVPISNIISRDLTQPLVWSQPHDLVTVQLDADEAGVWLASDHGQANGWHEIVSQDDLESSLGEHEIIYCVMEGHNYLMLKLHGKIVVTQATDDQFMQSEDEIKDRGVEWKILAGASAPDGTSIRRFGHATVRKKV